MGKKGRWFSAIKKVFTHNSSKEKPSDGSDKRINTEKTKKGKGILRHGERSKSFIPLFRAPSSVEEILGEADQLLIRLPPSSHEPKTPPPRFASPKGSSNRLNLPDKAVFQSTFTAGSSQTDFPNVTQSRRYVQRPEQTLRNRHLSATKIQAAYRGYLARRSFRALRGLVRLQGMVRSQNVKRQTINAMKQMQLLVRVQTQIQSRRIQMLENQTLLNQGNKKEADSTFGKWTADRLHEAESNGDWDDSLLTKEEIEARLRKKVEAVMKRERAMAYACSHKLWKSSTDTKSAQSPLQNHSNGFHLWWNYLDHPTNTPQKTQSATKKVASSTPPRPIFDKNLPSPQLNVTPNNQEHATRTKHFKTTPPIRTPSPSNVSGFTTKYSKPRPNNYSPFNNNDFALKDDDSLTSCPPFSVPNFMTPTVSAKAKTRANSNPKERVQLGTTPVNDSKRRFSFSFATPNIGSFKWNVKGPSKNEAVSQKVGFEKHQFLRSIGDLSVDSAVSMPAIVGRKPFNRFV